METAELTIVGMDCPDCARTLELGVARLGGVRSCAVNFGAARLHVTYDPAQTGETAIVRRVRDLHYDVADGSAAPPTPPIAEEATGWLGRGRAFVAFLAANRATRPVLAGAWLMGAGLLLAWSGLSHSLADVFFILALAIAGIPLALESLQTLMLTRRFTIGLLMSVAAVGALVIGEPAEGAAVVILFALGEALEGFTMQRARDSLSSLMKLAPAEALVLQPCIDCTEHLGRDGYQGGPCPWCQPHAVRTPVAQVSPGMTILVRPGDRVPLDGAISTGSSMVSQQHLTGESMPILRSIGDEVFAGSVNGEAAIEVQVTRPASEALLSRIANLVVAAQAQRAPIERFMDRFAAYYTPAVMVLAVLMASIPPLFFGQPFFDQADGTHGWLYRALALLVIACPCALVISTPVSVVSALSAATRAGALIRGGAVLEALRKVRVVAFDKTGTLTEGRPEVTMMQCRQGHAHDADCPDCLDMLALAAALENRTAHPLADAITRAAQRYGVAGRHMAEQVHALPGRGVEGLVNGQRVAVGSHAFFEEAHRHDASVCQAVTEAEAQGRTVMLVCACEQGGVLGQISLADQLRNEGRVVVEQLRTAGVVHTTMLTGDNGVVGQAIASAAGIDDVRHSLLPDAKLSAIQELTKHYGAVAMVGDGANDTPALAAATVGIAMGAAGSDQALATADVALIDDNLTRLPFLLRLSQRTHRIIMQNITASILVKVAFLVLAFLGTTSLWLAVAADSGIALLVILNGMRLLRERPS